LPANYAVLHRSSQQTDAVPPAAGGSPQISRQVQTGDLSLRQWVTVTQNTLCLIIDTRDNGGGATPSGCIPAGGLDGSPQLLLLGIGGRPSAGLSALAHSTTGRVVRADRPVPELEVGLAPDGVTKITASFVDGHALSTPVRDNGFHFATAGVMPTKLSWRTPDGVLHTEAL